MELSKIKIALIWWASTPVKSTCLDMSAQLLIETWHTLHRPPLIRIFWMCTHVHVCCRYTLSTASTSLPLWLQEGEEEEEGQRLRLTDGYEGWIANAALLCIKIPWLNLVLSSKDFERVEVLSLYFGTHYNIPLHGFAMPLKCAVL